MKFLLSIFVFLVLTSSLSYSSIYGVEDNATIEGNIEPLLYSEEIYIVRVTPSNESRDIQFSVYSRIGQISSQEQNVPRGTNYVNFYLKFFPPLYKIDEKYTLEVTGSGVIARSTITIREDPSVADAQKIKEQQIAEEKARQEEMARLAQQKAEEERQARIAQQKAQEEENARLAEEIARERERQLEQTRQEQEQARMAKQKAQEEENARLAEEIARERERQLEQARQNSQNQNQPTTKCGVGTVLENGICIPFVGNNIPQSTEDSETPSWIYLLPIVFIIILVTIIQKSRKNKTYSSGKQQTRKNKGYDKKTVNETRQYNEYNFNKTSFNEKNKSKDNDYLKNKIKKYEDTVNEKNILLSKLNQELNSNYKIILESKSETIKQTKKQIDIKVKINENIKNNNFEYELKENSEVSLMKNLQECEFESNGIRNKITNIENDLLKLNSTKNNLLSSVNNSDNSQQTSKSKKFLTTKKKLLEKVSILENEINIIELQIVEKNIEIKNQEKEIQNNLLEIQKIISDTILLELSAIESSKHPSTQQSTEDVFSESDIQDPMFPNSYPSEPKIPEPKIPEPKIPEPKIPEPEMPKSDIQDPMFPNSYPSEPEIPEPEIAEIYEDISDIGEKKNIQNKKIIKNKSSENPSYFETINELSESDYSDTTFDYIEGLGSDEEFDEDHPDYKPPGKFDIRDFEKSNYSISTPTLPRQNLSNKKSKESKTVTKKTVTKKVDSETVNENKLTEVKRNEFVVLKQNKPGEFYLYKNNELLWKNKFSKVITDLITMNSNGDCIIVTEKSKIYTINFIKLNGDIIKKDDLSRRPAIIETQNDIIVVKDLGNKLTSYQITTNSFKQKWQDITSSSEKFEVTENEIIIKSRNETRKCSLYSDFSPM